jgi:hypothetical protein
LLEDAAGRAVQQGQQVDGAPKFVVAATQGLAIQGRGTKLFGRDREEMGDPVGQSGLEGGQCVSPAIGGRVCRGWRMKLSMRSGITTLKWLPMVSGS